MKYAISQIAEIVKGDLLRHVEEQEISILLTDSRRLGNVRGTLFFAIRGLHHNGHKYLLPLFNKGVRNFVVEDDPLQWLTPEQSQQCNIIRCKKSSQALQDLAAHHRQQFHVPVVGITGSNGKTIVKEWLYQLLYRKMYVVRSPKSYNSQIGVPLSVWQLNEAADLGIFEAGISEPGEMQRLEQIIKPDTGIFTNIGEAHQAGFSSMEEKIREKLQLFVNCRTLIYCKDHELIDRQVHVWLKEQNPALQTFSWGKHPENRVQVLQEAKQGHQTLVRISFKGIEKSLQIPFIDRASVENALHCITLLLYMNIPFEEVQESLHSLTKVEMRLEIKKGMHGCTLINDSYNNDLASLDIALDVLMQQRQNEQKTVVLSNILQTGRDKNELYSEVAHMLKEKGVDQLIGVGEAISAEADVFTIPAKFFPGTDELLQWLEPAKFANNAVLLKGARPFAFERIAQRLEEKVHTTRLEVNMNAVVNNLNVYRSLVPAGTKIMVMVKALSYGSGGYEIANLMQFQQVDYLAVAYADEGVELRQRGIRLPIMVLNPDPAAMGPFLQYDLEPEIFSKKSLQSFLHATATERKGGREFNIHLKINTGMNRLGFEPEEVQQVAHQIAAEEGIRVASVFTHLVATEDAHFDEFTLQQLNTFEDAAEELQQVLGYMPLRHALNTSGQSRFPQYSFEMVRLGIGLYGFDASGELRDRLEPVGVLKTTISQIREVEAGETVSYNRSGKVHKTSTIATIGVGYADGINRKLGNGNWQVLVNGQKALTIGNICMDMCMIDITGIQAAEGDEVIVAGPENSFEEMAKVLGTISYEVLTAIGPRVKRVYYQE